MEKTTLRSLLLLTIITGSIFTLTACGPETKDSTDVAPLEVKEDGAVQVEIKKEEPKKDVKVDTQVKVDAVVTPKVGVDPKLVDTEPKGDAAPKAEATPKTEMAPKTEPKVEASTPVVQPEVKVTVYNNGSYTKTGSYNSPGGAESVTVTVNVKDDVVQSVNVVSNTNNETSKNFQGLFIAGINAQVVGKRLESVSVGVVNGSSLTGSGFNSAIASIKAEAKR